MTGYPAFALVPAQRLRPHEEVDRMKAIRLAGSIADEGAIHRPVAIDAGTFTILDGHHRHRALLDLSCRLIPCHLVDYRDPAIRVASWIDGRPMTKSAIIDAAMRGPLLPIKTSRHSTLRGLPRRTTPLSVLRRRGPEK